MTMKHFVAFMAGTLFALGLGLGGMTDPAKIVAFLDVTGAWDPSLALVMAGAIGVHVVVARRARTATAPRFAASFLLPTTATIDRRLLVGSALFGIGWGVAGYCPGPAIVSLVAPSPASLSFVAAMLAGMFLYAYTWGRPTPLQRAAAAQEESVT
jgi:uncharacterized protein